MQLNIDYNRIYGMRWLTPELQVLLNSAINAKDPKNKQLIYNKIMEIKTWN